MFCLVGGKEVGKKWEGNSEGFIVDIYIYSQWKHVCRCGSGFIHFSCL